jgi:50S ribosomal protein L16 3-hydroxylase
MLTEWLAPLDLETFWHRHIHKAPLASAGTASNALPLLTWETMERVLASEKPRDLVTVAGGRLVDVAPPRSVAQVRALLRTGVSVVIRDGERHEPGLGTLADAFAAVVPGEVHVQLYATPAGTNSYGWHYDFEDVFIAQTAGIKDYYFRANTVDRGTRLGDVLDFQTFRRETSPIYSARLLSADCLYIPSRWWHLVKCVEDSLSLSIGVMPPEELGRAHPHVRRPARP